MKKLIFFVLMLISSYAFAEVRTFIDMSGRIIYCEYKDLPSGIYFEKTEDGIKRFAKI